ncbi:MAG: CmpA/NrtA family ABC transporter substrate-binding protein [Gemmobacter sp.]|nr:CmpA/NrtA family ABC transporter substrate-binding protein [Gemmobacter sp.]
MSLERTELRLGFIALNDCAPLVIAREKGFFEAEGLSVDLSREASWANIRDKVAMGALDGAHMLGPMPLAVRLGVCGEPAKMIAPMSLNLNGSASPFPRPWATRMRAADPEGMSARPRTARPLAKVIAARKAQGALLTFAVVFPFSVHNYELRYWLAEAGIDPDRDLRVVVTPPARMTARLTAGDLDGFCVGAPWNAQAVADGRGEIMAYAAELWRVGPDKVFGVTEAVADANPNTLGAVLRSLLRAAAWCDAPGHRAELAAILSHPRYVDAPEEVVARSLTGAPPYAPGEAGPDDQDYIIYHRYAANFPWRSHAVWYPDPDAALGPDTRGHRHGRRRRGRSIGRSVPGGRRGSWGRRRRWWTRRWRGCTPRRGPWTRPRPRSPWPPTCFSTADGSTRPSRNAMRPGSRSADSAAEAVRTPIPCAVQREQSHNQRAECPNRPA